MTRGKEVLVGVVIVLGVVVALVGTLWLQDASFGRGTREVEALFLEVGQLMNGNSVKLRGVTIGRVLQIAVEPDGKAVRVRMSIRDDVALPDDPAALVAPESLFGDWQAEIVPRSAYSQFDFYPAPDPTALAGYALPDISRLTAAADQISKDLSSLSTRVEEAFTDETAQNLALAINNIEEVSQRLRDLVEVQASAFSNLASEVETAAVELGGAARTANLTFQRAEEILGAPTTDSLLLDARATLANLKDLSGELGTTNQRAQGLLLRADSTFARLDRMSAQVEAGEGALGALMGDKALVARAQAVLEQIDVLLKDLRENPQRYVRISIF
jgi:phospholipid/cholesterol/gamma-HCH transport system substrate-binding protein